MEYSQILNPTDHNPKGIIKGDKDFAKKLDFKAIKFPVKVRDTEKIENIPSTLVFFLWK